MTYLLYGLSFWVGFLASGLLLLCAQDALDEGNKMIAAITLILSGLPVSGMLFFILKEIGG